MQCSQYSTITAFSIYGTYSVPNSMQVRNIHNTLWNMSPTFPTRESLLPCTPYCPIQGTQVRTSTPAPFSRQDSKVHCSFPSMITIGN